MDVYRHSIGYGLFCKVHQGDNRHTHDGTYDSSGKESGSGKEKLLRQSRLGLQPKAVSHKGSGIAQKTDELLY